ncbi:MAG: type II toxin-antitoxin system ParD family antitoxin [Bacteroidales bacterium]|nr:type II toxin-antitoxin system ParD family antitoxin [Bacteroidales bacterium]
MNTTNYQKIKDLRSAIQEGLNSGISKDFNPESFLKEMKTREEGFSI